MIYEAACNGNINVHGYFILKYENFNVLFSVMNL